MSRALHVLHICCDTAYGCLAAVSELAAGQAELSLGVQVALMREHGRRLSAFRVRRMQEAGVEVHILDLPKLRLWMRPRFVARGAGIPNVVSDTIRWARTSDLVHGHGSLGAAYAYWTGRRLGLPAVGTQHGLEPGAFRPLAWRWLAGRLHGSNSLARPSGTPELGNGIDARGWRSMAVGAPDLRSSIGVSSGATLIGLVGRVVGDKQQLSFLDALSGELAEQPEVAVAVIGEGPELAELERLSGRRPWRGRLHLLGYVDDMPSVYRALDVLVVPSQREAESMVILEAMASGVPVVATAVGGTPKLLAQGAGVLIPPSDLRAAVRALLPLLSDPQRRAEVAAQAQQRVEEHFSSTRAATAYLEELYRPALGGRPNAE